MRSSAGTPSTDSQIQEHLMLVLRIGYDVMLSIIVLSQFILERLSDRGALSDLNTQWCMG